MTSRSLKRFAASSGTAALVLVGVLALGSGFKARAQSEDPGLKGTWRLQVTVRDCQTGQALRTWYANRDDRRPAPLVKHSQLGCLAAH